MEQQEAQNTPNNSGEALKDLQKEMMIAFKAGDQQAWQALAGKIRQLDPENHMVAKLMAKWETERAKEKAKAKAEKAKEYENMLKTLLKEGDTEKLMALAKEFKEFDPENSHADKWLSKAEKLTEKPSESKETKGTAPGFLKALFKKKDQPEAAEGEAKAMPAPVPEAVKPVTPMAPAPASAPASAPAPAPAIQPVVPAIPTEVKSEANREVKEGSKEEAKEEKGNLFTRMFRKSDDEIKKGSIIDAIVAKTDKKDEPERTRKPDMARTLKASKEGDAQTLLTFSKIFMNFAVVFIVFSAIFLYVEWIDKENTVLSIVGIQENTGLRLHAAAEEVDQLKLEEEALNEEIELYKGGYNDQALATVQTIMDDRIDWPSIFAKIKEVTNSVYELNDFFKYIEYNDYSFDANTNTVRVSGSLSDPLGRNLTKLVELEEAFMNYPRDKNDPEDLTKPYFIGFKEFTSFSKTLDSETGRYTSSFQLSFTLNE